jgi:hypothetical protein
MLFHQSATPNMKDFSFNGRTPRACRHTLDRLKKDLVGNPNLTFGAVGNDGNAGTPTTPKGNKRKTQASAAAASASKKAKTAAEDVDSDDEKPKVEAKVEANDSEVSSFAAMTTNTRLMSLLRLTTKTRTPTVATTTTRLEMVGWLSSIVCCSRAH